MSNSATLLHNAKEDCGSDHNPIVATFRVKLRKLRRNKSQPKLLTDLLRSENKYGQKLCQQLSARIRDMARTDEMETRYTEFSNILID